MPSLHSSTRLLGNHSSNRLLSACRIRVITTIDRQKERSFHKSEIAQEIVCTAQTFHLRTQLEKTYAENN